MGELYSYYRAVGMLEYFYAYVAPGAIASPAPKRQTMLSRSPLAFATPALAGLAEGHAAA